MAPWANAWGMDEMFAGVGSNGAEDAWMDLAIQIEHATLSDEPYCGGTTDIVKCFDQIYRSLLYNIASVAGMPLEVLAPYKAFMSKLMLHNTVAGEVGLPYSRQCGIPQGCPLSMLMG